jgi:hypothetical protein
MTPRTRSLLRISFAVAAAGAVSLGLSALGFEGGPVLFGGLEQVSSHNDSSCDHIRVVGPTTVVIPPGCKP